MKRVQALVLGVAGVGVLALAHQPADRADVVGCMRALVATPDIAWVSYDGRVAAELMSSASDSFRHDGQYANVEGPRWHLHLERAHVRSIACHPASFSLHLRDADATSVVSVYFLEMFDGDEPRPDRVRRYQAVCRRFANPPDEA